MGGGRKKKLAELEKSQRLAGYGADGITIPYALAAETDRGCALVAAEFLSDALEALLLAKFENEEAPKEVKASLVEGFTAPLGTFAMRAKACRAFGLIDQDTYQAIEMIREIRNECGHRKGLINLQDKETIQYVHWLSGFVSRHPATMPDGSLTEGAQWWNDELDVSRHSKERITFMDAASLAWMFVRFGVYELKDGRKFTPWTIPTAQNEPQSPQE